jgi:hypothetical protein
VPVLPLLLCTRPARPRPSIGGQSPTPAPRQLPWSPPRGWCSCRLPYSAFDQLAHFSSSRQAETRDYVLPRSPGAAVVEPRYALWGRATARCTLGHVTHSTSRKSCAVGPLHPKISSTSAPCLFSCGKWVRAVSYMCQYSNMSIQIQMINLAHSRRSMHCRQVMPHDPNEQTARNNTTAAVRC